MKTTTNCPTCGATCTIEGDVTHYYSPNTTGVLSDGQALATAKLLELQQRIAELQAENKRLLADNRRIMDENLRLLDERAKWQIKAERLAAATYESHKPQ